MQMTQEIWDTLSPGNKESKRDNSDLSRQLIGLEGWRVEVLTKYGEKRRFIVGKSTGWKPCHIELNNRRSMGGPSAESEYLDVVKLYRAR